MTASDFRHYNVSAPTYEEVAAEYDALQQRLDAAADPSAWIETVMAWDQLRRQLYDWHAVVQIRFHQDTRNRQFKEAKELCDQLQPKLTDLAVRMKRMARTPLPAGRRGCALGDHLLNLWECDIASFDPVIEADLVRQSELEAAAYRTAGGGSVFLPGPNADAFGTAEICRRSRSRSAASDGKNAQRLVR